MSDMIPDFFDCVVRERVARLHAEAARAALLRSLRPPRRSARVVLGQSLVAIGRWVLGPAPSWTADWTEEPGRPAAARVAVPRTR